MRIQKPTRNLRKVKSNANLRKMHSIPDHPRQGVLVDESFGDLLQQRATGVYFLLEVNTHEPGLTPHEIIEAPEPEPTTVNNVSEVELEEIVASHDDHDSDIEMQDS
ncbi:LANO_0G04962g1_1 [Lachancea nothofagi CBS 11611]|uniref:LANO_0G04962g1_1 n=1 Tax=Lachancea nothofagi CBS 11611 TaxID=1266666 RepID=A0A1G4KGE0_9SACH|nr:LANO_0G04962g1_1 [Lachancea nothofagi CBS 11611]